MSICIRHFRLLTLAGFLLLAFQVGFVVPVSFEFSIRDLGRRTFGHSIFFDLCDVYRVGRVTRIQAEAKGFGSFFWLD